MRKTKQPKTLAATYVDGIEELKASAAKSLANAITTGEVDGPATGTITVFAKKPAPVIADKSPPKKATDFTACPVDLSRYQGLEFSIGGVVSPNRGILLQVFTGEDNYVQLANMPPSSDDVVLHNGCLWKTNMYLECVEPSRTIVVPASATTTAPTKLSFTWNQFVGGRPLANPNPALISRIQFLPLTPPATSATDGPPSYDIDVVVDDLALLSVSPDGGADAPVDAGAGDGAATDASTSDGGDQ